jgi:hypothetical protein
VRRIPGMLRIASHACYHACRKSCPCQALAHGAAFCKCMHGAVVAEECTAWCMHVCDRERVEGIHCISARLSTKRLVVHAICIHWVHDGGSAQMHDSVAYAWTNITIVYKCNGDACVLSPITSVRHVCMQGGGSEEARCMSAPAPS